MARIAGMGPLIPGRGAGAALIVMMFLAAREGGAENHFRHSNSSPLVRIGMSAKEVASASGSYKMASGQALSAGESLTSNNGRYNWILQNDGNFVL